MMFFISDSKTQALAKEILKYKEEIVSLTNEIYDLKHALRAVQQREEIHLWLKNEKEMLLKTAEEAKKLGITKIKFNSTEIELK